MNWEELYEAYQKRIKSRKKPNTARTYLYGMERWEFTSKPTADSVAEKIAGWEKEGITGKTISVWVASLRYLLNYFPEEFSDGEIRSIEKNFGELDVNNKKMACATEEEVEKLVSTTDSRTVLVIGLLFYTGLRISEVADLTLDRITTDGIYIPSSTSKGINDRVLPVHEKLKTLMEGYLRYTRPYYESFNKIPTNRLIITKRGATTGNYLGSTVKKACIEAGFPHLHDHAFRHGLGTQLARKGADLEIIRKILGHSKLETTRRYIDYNTNDIENAMGKAFGGEK